MRKWILALLFISVLCVYGDDWNDLIPEFVIDSMSILLENGETIAFREHYDDVMKKRIKPVREYTEKVIKFDYKVLDYGAFEVMFDIDSKVSHVFLTKKGSRLLQTSIGIGDGVDELIEKISKDKRYRLEVSDGKKIDLDFRFSDPYFGDAWEKAPAWIDYNYFIYMEYENSKISYISCGFDLY